MDSSVIRGTDISDPDSLPGDTGLRRGLRAYLKTGKPLLMEKLNAYQRRLVHNELAKMPGICTESEDTDSRFKRITISRV